MEEWRGSCMNLTEKYLSILVKDMYSVVCATTDDEHRPVTRVIDIMLADEHTFYFLTAKGKSFYHQLMKEGFIALSGMAGGEGMDRATATMHKKAISIRGKVECIGTEKLDEIFAADPFMAEIYPKKESRKALVVFKMTEGTGEFFDLSVKPIFRESFTIGNPGEAEKGEMGREPYFITDACIGCGRCVAVCPQNCIRQDKIPCVINQKHCLHCGNCFAECPVKAVVRR